MDLVEISKEIGFSFFSHFSHCFVSIDYQRTPGRIAEGCEICDKGEVEWREAFR